MKGKSYWGLDYCKIICKYIPSYLDLVFDKKLFYPKVLLEDERGKRIASLPGFISGRSSELFFADLTVLVEYFDRNINSIYIQHLNEIQLPQLSASQKLAERNLFILNTDKKFNSIISNMNQSSRTAIRKCLKSHNYELKNEPDSDFSILYHRLSEAQNFSPTYMYTFKDMEIMQTLPNIIPLMLYRDSVLIGGCLIGERSDGIFDYIVSATKREVKGESKLLLAKAAEYINVNYNCLFLNLGGGHKSLENYKSECGGILHKWFGITIKKEY
tara:strand:+ start:4276 stop:5091 length:816 start_codon:yes stop_codon:yes gene_type:complete